MERNLRAAMSYCKVLVCSVAFHWAAIHRGVAQNHGVHQGQVQGCCQESKRRSKLLEAAESWDRALLQEMRKVLGSKHQKQELPNNPGGLSGANRNPGEVSQLGLCLIQICSNRRPAGCSKNPNGLKGGCQIRI